MAVVNRSSILSLAQRRLKTKQPVGVTTALQAPAAPSAPAAPAANTNATRLPASDSGLSALAANTTQAPDEGVRAAPKLNEKPLQYTPSWTTSGPSGGSPDPRDASYWADLAKLKWQGEQGAAEIQRQDVEADISTGRALTDLASQRNYQDRGTRQSLASRGLGSSTTGFETFAREEGAYGLAQSRTLEDYGRGETARQAAINAIQSGFTVEEAAQYAQAADRKAQRDLEAARNAPPDPVATPAAPGYQPPAAGTSPGPAAGPPPFGRDSYWTGTRWVKIGASVPASHGNYASGSPPSKNHAWTGTRWLKVR